MGRFRVKGCNLIVYGRFPFRSFRHPRSEPDFTIRSFPHQIKLTFGRRSWRLHQYPARGGCGSGDETILNSGFLTIPLFGSSTWIRQD